MASSVISSRLNNVLVRICDAAKKQEHVHRSVGDALYDIISDDSCDFALCEVDLDNKILRSGDIVVGFRADTDASFTIVVKDKIRIPFTMKAGEFHLAWKNKATIPGISIKDDIVLVEGVNGRVTCIMACMNIWARREMYYLCKVYLEPTWVIEHGSLHKTDKYNMTCGVCGKNGSCILHP